MIASVRRFLGGCPGLAALLIVAATMAAAAAESPVSLDAADFVLSDAPQPPPDAAPWQRQALPDTWEDSRPGVGGYAWYRLHFELPSPPEHPSAIFVPVLRTTGALFVNGVYVGRSGPFETPERAQHPHFFPIPPSVLRAGSNIVHLRMRVLDGWPGALSKVSVGDETELRVEYERLLFWLISGPQIVGAFSTVMSLSMLTLWWRRRSESAYAYFGLSALFFAAFIASFFVREPLASDIYRVVVAESSLGWSIVLMCLFSLRYAGWHWRRAELLLWTYAAVTPILVYARENGTGWWLAEHWDLTSHAITAVPTVIFIAVAWRRRTAATIVLSGTALGALAISVHEHVFRYPADLPSLLPYAYVPMYIAIGWILVDGFVRSLNESEQLNVELKWRVAQTMAELELSHRHVEYVERQKEAVLEERKRIMSEMHDGVGAQLITTLSLVERGDSSSAEVAAALRECLDDLRLTIDSLEPAENDLLPVLGNLRYRLDGRLKRCGIALDWRVNDVPMLSCLTPQNVLHILRILQEAFANVVKHANATTVKVETGVDRSGTRVYIRVSDNGTGFSGERTGRGFANMRRRAQFIGAGLEILPSPTGTVLSLLLPIG